MLSTLLYPLLIIPPWTTGLVLITLHQSLLSFGGVTSYVINGLHGDDTRDTLISANREGIVSSLGYLALYFFGMEIGRFVFQSRCVHLHDISNTTEYCNLYYGDPLTKFNILTRMQCSNNT